MIFASAATSLENAVQAIPELLSRCLRPACGTDPALLKMPNDYHAPCHTGPFQMQFYWDTFFVNRVLLSLGRVREAREAIENLVHVLDDHGHVPNCNHSHFINRSQPPMLTLMVGELLAVTGDIAWLNKVLPALIEEHRFWEENRSFETGLSHYGHNATTWELISFSEILVERLKMTFKDEENRIEVASHYLAEAESGWDFTPRFEGRCEDFAPVDLNALLFRVEVLLSAFLEKTGNSVQSSEFSLRAQHRRDLMDRVLWDQEKGLYRDFDTKNRSHSPVHSMATLYPLWCGAASTDQANHVAKNISLFECDHGLSACARGSRSSVYQWDWPNGWAPLHLFAVEGLQRYGFCDDASRIAGKFLTMVARCHQNTGEFWEKYNVVTGALDVHDEYEMPPLVGWTAAALSSLYPLLVALPTNKDFNLIGFACS